MIFQTEDLEIIELYNQYKLIKQMIEELQNLHKHLLQETLIKKSASYTVLYNDKFTFDNAKKFNKLILNDYNQKDKQLFLFGLLKQTDKYIFRLDDGRLILNSHIDWQDEHYLSESISIIGQFKFHELYDIQKKLKALIICKKFNIDIEII